MITAIDTNILFDIFIPDEPFGEESEVQLTAALGRGALVISEAVFAEVSARFDHASVSEFLLRTGIRLESSSQQSLQLAGEAWARYTRRRPDGFTCATCGNHQQVRCMACGSLVRTRQHVLSDFLIGAHASIQADCLLTRDRGYLRRYFPDLPLV